MKKMKRVFALALMALSLMAVALPAMAVTGIPANTYAYTIKGDVAVRTSANSGDNILSRVDTGTKVYILTTTNSSTGYYKVRIDGLTSGAYILSTCIGTTNPNGGTGGSSGYPSDVKTSTKYSGSNTTVNDPLNVRQTASANAAIIGKIPVGAAVTYYKTNSTSWHYALTPVQGYVSASFIRETGTGGSTTNPWDGRYGPSDLSSQSQNATQYIRNMQADLQEWFTYVWANSPNGWSGYTVPQTGTYGTGTQDAVRKFQIAYGLSNDGIFGNQCKAVLWDYKN